MANISYIFRLEVKGPRSWAHPSPGRSSQLFSQKEAAEGNEPHLLLGRRGETCFIGNCKTKTPLLGRHFVAIDIAPPEPDIPAQSVLRWPACEHRALFHGASDKPMSGHSCAVVQASVFIGD